MAKTILHKIQPILNYEMVRFVVVVKMALMTKVQFISIRIHPTATCPNGTPTIKNK